MRGGMRYNRTMEKIDLHGRTVKEALEEFTLFYNSRLATGKSGEFEVVHGYGSSGEGGLIRKRLRKYLDQHAKKLLYRKGENYLGNPGATYVTPLQPLPSAADALQADILDYCQQARTEAKILGKFRQHGQKPVKQALTSMTKEGLLRRFNKGAYVHYERA